MLSIKLSSETLTLDPAHLPAGDAFDKLFLTLSSSAAASRDVEEIAFLYRHEYGSARRLLDLAHRHALAENGSEEAINSIRITTLGLLVQHRRATEADFYELNSIQDKRLDLLKGFHLYTKREYEDALFSFSKIPYKFGIELCMLEMGREFASRGDDARMRCYADAREWSSFRADSSAASKDFLFRIGQSSTYASAENADVRLALIEQALDENEPDLTGILHQLEELRKDCLESAEVHYLIGKVHHIRRDYAKAKEFYGQALERQPGYPPAELNMQRIAGETPKTQSRHESVNDYIALTSIMGGRYDMDLSNCSDRIRKLCLLVSKSRRRDPSCAEEIEGLLAGNNTFLSFDQKELKPGTELFDKEVLYNSLAIMSGDQGNAAQLLEKGMEGCARKYEDFLKYNLGTVTGDVDMLAGSTLPEADERIALIKEDATVSNASLRGFILMKESPAEAKAIFKKQMDSRVGQEPLFASICLGTMYIDDYLSDQTGLHLLEEAANAFRRFPRSFYCVNGLAICFALKGRPDIALRLLKQIVADCAGAPQNAANCYILGKDYQAAAETLLKMHGGAEQREAEYAASLLKLICKETGDLALIDRCLAEGIAGLEEQKAELERCQKDAADAKEEERKRKIQEIENYRKKMNFN